MTVEHDIKIKFEKYDGGHKIGRRNKTQGRNDADFSVHFKATVFQKLFQALTTGGKLIKLEARTLKVTQLEGF